MATSTGRISTAPPPSTIGHRPASSTACAMSRASTTMKPRIRSFSAYRPVGDRLLPAANDLPRRVERLPRMLQVPFRFEIADPGQPRLQALLCTFGRAHGFAPPGLRRSEQVDELAHRVLPCSAQLKLRPPHAFNTSTFDGRRAGHISSAGRERGFGDAVGSSGELAGPGKPGTVVRNLPTAASRRLRR